MAHEVLYKNPSDEVLYSVDFTDELPNDTALDAGSDVSAVDSDGTDASATVLGTESETGMTVTAVLQAGSDGEDYRITFTARGSTTTRDATKIVEMRVRSYHLGNV
ncbi:MAG: hypothetical protein MN733_43430 [Nitrososphaera sp.]|nr:hypothetical protein [Nitrososphaera sp.]